MVIIPGGLNTDIIGLGVQRLIGPGELTIGGELKIGPGGKASNIAQMVAAILGPGRVAMIGRTSCDPYGFWKAPLDALNKFGVDTSFVKKMDFETSGKKFPGIALIPVDKYGQNQIYVLPGINADFCFSDLEEAKELFKNQDGEHIMILSLEIPLPVAQKAVELANASGIRVILDPGGINGPINELINEKVYLIKPNEFECQMLTGLEINGFDAARQAADILIDRGVHYVMITHGAQGAYFFGPDIELNISIPLVEEAKAKDATGCGDQVTAVMAACLAEGLALDEAAKLAVRAGTLQFQRNGIQPLDRGDILIESRDENIII